MAASQSTSGPVAASGSTGGDAAAGGSTPSAPGVAAATASSNAPAAASKSGSPAANATTTTASIPQRDKGGLNKVLVDRYVTRDWIHSTALKDAQDKLQKDMKETLQRLGEYKSIRMENRAAFPPSRLYGEGYSGYGNGWTEAGGPTKIVYPTHKPRPGKRTTPAFKCSRKDMKKLAEQYEELVPIRIDVDWDKVKLRDTFTFNVHERLISPEHFSMQLVEDMGLKAPLDKPVQDQVVQQMIEQINDFYPFIHREEEALDPELPYSAYKNDEMRILVKLNITIGAHTLVDQFEWDINNPNNSPEEFAACMARDLSLSGEFTTAIAHCIREQAQLFTRSLFIIGHPFDGRPIEDPDLVSAFLPSPLPSVFRPQQQAKEYAPYLYENTEAELERSETMFSREQRRQKRSVNRRGGPQLPDLKERQRTIRTSIVSSVLPGAALDIEDSRIFKRTTTGTGGATGRGGRRAARDGEISDSDDSEDSGPDSPAMSQLQGTARTRGIRGAASAAAVRMANLGRSETPEATIHHHETRTSRRFGGGREAARDETEEPLQHIVTLKVSPLRLGKLFRDLKARQQQQQQQQQSTPGPAATPSAAHHQRAPSTASAAAGSMRPPSTPSALGQALPSKSATPAAAPATSVHSQIGRVPAPGPAPPGKPAPPLPPAPEWLTACLQNLLTQYPNDLFEATMRHSAVNTKTDMLVQLQPGKEIPPDVQFMFLPRIRCLDCPGKLYTPGPEMTVNNFEVHLKNRHHRERVDARMAKTGGGRPAGAGAGSGAGAGAAGASQGPSSSTLPATSDAPPPPLPAQPAQSTQPAQPPQLSSAAAAAPPPPAPNGP
ncbi:SNF5-like protein [Diplogelasinospora grovesii]|uniref:SNF5-like protein n=1 Tax=Diplogelasinospora grovesii TaxID=303347 RepID=A0AAN6S477_9PEZI|nr:SNF5-like protein [Diplogelasinospora grovesii]